MKKRKSKNLPRPIRNARDLRRSGYAGGVVILRPPIYTVTVFLMVKGAADLAVRRIDRAAGELGGERMDAGEIHAGEIGVAYRFQESDAAGQFKGSLSAFGATSL